MSIRSLKNEIRNLLVHDDFETGMQAICHYPPKQVINLLFAFLYSTHALEKWRAVSAMGRVVSTLSQNKMEDARIIFRRLIWNLNDESGGIGWGTPEAMGEITASAPKMAAEYHNILISYIMPGGNYIEHPMLQRGVVWGIGRLATARPQLAQDTAPYLEPYLSATDPVARGYAAWAALALGHTSLHPSLQRLRNDTTTIDMYFNGYLAKTPISSIAGRNG